MNKNNTKYTPTEALECLQNISKNTFYNDMKNGSISYIKEPWGKKTRRYVEGSELARFYGESFVPQRLPSTSQNIETGRPTTLQENIKTYPENNILQTEVKFLKEQLEDKKQIITDLRDERNDWKKQAQTLLLQSPSSKTEETPLEQQKIGLPNQPHKNPSTPFKSTLWAVVAMILAILLVLSTKSFWLPHAELFFKG